MSRSSTRNAPASIVANDAQSDTELVAQNVTSDDTSDAGDALSDDTSDAQNVTSDAEQSDTRDAGDAEQSDTPASSELAGDALSAAAAQFVQVPATPATPAKKMTRAHVKRVTSVRMIELIYANIDALCTFDDDDMSDAARAFVANYFSYAPAIESRVSHSATIDEIVAAARSLS